MRTGFWNNRWAWCCAISGKSRRRWTICCNLSATRVFALPQRSFVIGESADQLQDFAAHLCLAGAGLARAVDGAHQLFALVELVLCDAVHPIEKRILCRVERRGHQEADECELSHDRRIPSRISGISKTARLRSAAAAVRKHA